MAKTTVTINPNEFQGYPVELLRSLKGLGPAIIGDDVLHAAVKAYTEQAAANPAGSVLGPALLTADCTMVVQSNTAKAAPETMTAPAVVDDGTDEPSDTTWDAHDLDSLNALVKKHGVTIDGRVKTAAKLIAALEAAGVTP